MGGIRIFGGTTMRSVNMLLFVVLLLGAPWRNASAIEYCVGTVAELTVALNDAAGESSELFTTTVKLKQGTYHIGGTRLTQPNQAFFHALELLGGYNSDCSARVIKPDNTVFDADAADIVRIQPINDLLIEGIRFQNVGNSKQVQVLAAAAGVTASLRNNAFVGVSSWNVPGPTPDRGSASDMAINFLNNRVHGFPGFASVSAVYMGAMSSIRFTGNTIVDNQGENGVYICSSSSNVWLLDNIAWNNNGQDFRVYEDCGDTDLGEARFRANLYQSAQLTPISDSGDNLVGSDPQFINPGAGNYRIQTTSPAVNAGVVSSSSTSVDLDGNPRVVGSTVDMGAYESSVDDTIPTTLTVTSTSDSGPGSLRQAILDANANEDFSFIRFNIPGNCPRVILNSSANLPTITNGVLIDGWSQPGSRSNTRSKGDNAYRCILLVGGNGRTTGLVFGGSGSEQFWLQGMAFSGFSTTAFDGEALRIAGGGGNLIRGNQFGGTLSTPSGTLALQPSDNNIVLTQFSESTVGGDLPAHRNVIADASAAGVLINSGPFGSSTNNEITNNLFGSYGLEITAAGNFTGIKIQTSGNTVSDNTIINSGLDGVLMDVAAASGNLVQNNRIGIADTICIGDFCFGGSAPNGRFGIYLSFGPHDNIIYRNTIRYNTSAGISIGSSAGATSLRNWLVANSLYNNGAQGTLFNVYNGADNDALASNQDMANRGLNYPEVTRAYGGTRKGWVEGRLRTLNGSYPLDVFSSAAPDPGFPRGEAEVFHRSYYSVVINNAPNNQNGVANFRVSFSASPAQSLVGRVVTLTAADNVGNTSELSAPVAYLCDVIYSHNMDDTLGDRCP